MQMVLSSRYVHLGNAKSLLANIGAIRPQSAFSSWGMMTRFRHILEIVAYIEQVLINASAVQLASQQDRKTGQIFTSLRKSYTKE